MTNIEYVTNLAAMYLCKSEDPKDLDKVKPIPYCKDGYSWYSVGHNCDSFFYLAVDNDGNLWKRSLSCDYNTIHDDVESYIENIEPCSSQKDVKYIGHW